MMIFGFGLLCFGVIVILALVGLIIYFAVRSSRNSSRQQRTGYSYNEEAVNILNERYAKGEISDEEYMKKKAVIKEQ